MIDGSRRGSVHTVQGFWVSILPQILQTWILSIATCSAVESGVISASRFLIRCSAARRAERGPSPGSRASSWIRRSISGPATAAAMSGEAQPRRQTQSAGQRLHLFLHRGFRLAPRVIMRRDQQVLEDFALLRLDQRGVDLHRLHFHLGGHAHGDEAATRNTLDLDMAEFFLHRLHLRLQLRRLLHHAEKISHQPFLLYRYSSLSELSAGSSTLASDSGGSGASLRTSTTLAPGKRASTSLTRGSDSAARSRAFFCISFCERSVGCPASLDTITVQRRPVHCSSLRDRSLISVRAALRSSVTSSRPSSMRTRRTSASSADLVRRSRFAPASATSSGKLAIRSTAAAGCASDAGAIICGRAETSALARGADAARGGEDGIEETPDAELPDEALPEPCAPRGMALAAITGEAPPFCSSILIASSGVGRSAT